MIHFDSTITVGNLLEMGCLGLSAFAVYHKITLKMASLEFKVNLIWNKMYPGLADDASRVIR